MNQSHRNRIRSGHTLLTILKSGASLKWPDGTEIEGLPELEIVVIKARINNDPELWMHFYLDKTGVNEAMHVLADWRRNHEQG